MLQSITKTRKLTLSTLAREAENSALVKQASWHRAWTSKVDVGGLRLGGVPTEVPTWNTMITRNDHECFAKEVITYGTM